MRITRENAMMEIVKTMSQRSTCARKRVGCVLTKDNRIVATGYNGAPTGMPHCIDNPSGCELNDQGGCKTSVHAEAAMISFCARKGIPTEGCTLYVTLSPCYECAKLIINAGIKTVLFETPYRDIEGFKLLIKAGVRVVCLSEHLRGSDGDVKKRKPSQHICSCGTDRPPSPPATRTSHALNIGMDTSKRDDMAEGVYGSIPDLYIVLKGEGKDLFKRKD